MKLTECIEQLESLLLDRKSFLVDDVDSCKEITKDIEALEIAIKELKVKKVQENNCEKILNTHQLKILNRMTKEGSKKRSFAEIYLDDLRIKCVKEYEIKISSNEDLSELILRLDIDTHSIIKKQI